MTPFQAGGTSDLPGIPRNSATAAQAPVAQLSSKVRTSITSQLSRTTAKVRSSATRHDANQVRYETLVNDMRQRVQVAPSAGAGASGAAQRCACLIDKTNQQLGPFDANMLQALTASCIQDEAAAFKAAADGGVSVDGCRPWYMRRKLWMLGGGVLGAALLIKVLR